MEINADVSGSSYFTGYEPLKAASKEQQALAASAVSQQENLSAAGEEEKRPWMPEELEKEVDEMNKGMEAFNTTLTFKVHKETGTLMVRFIDKETDEVVKEYPPEDFLDMKAKIREYIGMLLDEKA